MAAGRAELAAIFFDDGVRTAVGTFFANHGSCFLRRSCGAGGSAGRWLRQATVGDDALNGVCQQGDFAVVPEWNAAAVVAQFAAVAYGPSVPGDLAQVVQCLVEKTAARRQAQAAHGGGDPLLAFASLAYGHEELDGAFKAIDHHKADDQIQAPRAVMREVFNLVDDGVERAFGAALDHG